jgi:hypothetical protein
MFRDVGTGDVKNNFWKLRLQWLVLSSPITLHNTHFAREQNFNFLFKLSENTSYIIFAREKINPAESRVFIRKQDIVFIITLINNRR